MNFNTILDIIRKRGIVVLKYKNRYFIEVSEKEIEALKQLEKMGIKITYESV